MWISELRYQDPRTKTYLGSPSITRLPTEQNGERGALVASHDYFGKGCPHNLEDEECLTSIYRSEDNGLTWQNITHVVGAFWSTLFVHRDTLYLLGTSAQHGHIVIRRSDDGGYTWTYPVDEDSGLLFRGGPGLVPPNYHCAPMPVLLHNGRLYRAFEDDVRQKYNREFSSLVVSVAEDADLLKSSNWTMSNKLGFDHSKGPQYTEQSCWIEGNVVADREGQLWNVLRFNSKYETGPLINHAAFLKIEDDGATQTLDYETGFRYFPGGATKFTVRWDPVSSCYWTLVNYQQSEPLKLNRNRLSVYTSPDLSEWTCRKVLLDGNLEGTPEEEAKNTGFQYVDWIFDPAEENTLLYLARTAYDGAHNFHDSNRITFSRIRDFRNLLEG
jgi:hypothetical protein